MLGHRVGKLLPRGGSGVLRGPVQGTISTRLYGVSELYPCPLDLGGPRRWGLWEEGNLRVVSGFLKGRKLKTLSGYRLRPTSQRVKEAIFDLVQPEWDRCDVLDLFAGSGALGIEALSRGAKKAVFVERDPAAARLLRENLSRMGLVAMAKVVRADALRFLRKGPEMERYQIVFADPPYGKDLARRCLLGLAEGGWVAQGGMVVMEHSKREEMEEKIGSLVLASRRRYGDTLVSLYVAS